MSLSTAFLDEIRARTTLSALIGQSIKTEKAGREHKACCPFHGEKTPSFTINDEKGFYHCFGCGAHGDAIRWLTDHGGMDFMDAVKDLAGQAGLEMPERTPEQAERTRRAEHVGEVLGEAAEWFGGALEPAGVAMEALAARGITDAAIARFGLGFAPARGSISSIGIALDQLIAAGLIVEGANGRRDRFRNRIMVPIHDARGRTIGFGGRALGDNIPKYLNSDQSDHFDKGRVLFNLHRAAPAARSARRLLIVEGYFDVIALDQAGISEAVAPMGTAITPEQLERAWRVMECPVLLLDGDEAGRKAAARACIRALPMAGPGRSLKIAMLPDGSDPDDLVRACGREAIDNLVSNALSLSSYVWTAVLAAGNRETPEGRAAIWAQLAELAQSVQHDETRAQYQAYWRSLFDAAFPPVPRWVVEDQKLPVGSVEAVFSDQTAVVQERLRAVAAMRLKGMIASAERTKDGVTLFAWGIGRRVGAGLIDQAMADDAIDDVAADVEDVGAEDIDKSFAAGVARGFDVGPMLLDMKCAGFQRTDLGNAERFEARYGNAFRFTTAKGWLGWDGRRWKVLDQDKDTLPAEVQAAVFATVRAIQREADFVAATGFVEPEEPIPDDGKPPLLMLVQWKMFRDSGERDSAMDRVVDLKSSGPVIFSEQIAKWGRASEAAGKLGCIAGLAKRWVTAPIEDFDRDPLAINVLNGTLRFRRDKRNGSIVTLEPHRREDLNTKLAPVNYDEAATSAIYDGFLEWAQPDPGMRRYLHQWAGYSASGDISEQKLHFWYGLGANGKSTAIDLWAYVLGDYSGTIGIETFLDQGIKKRGEQASPDLARLGGVRLLRASEPERGAKLNEALIKAATGGEPMAVRALHRGFFDLVPLFKLTIGGNYKPDIPGTDEGIWRRMKLVPWKAHVEDGDRDELLPAKLREEAAGVLNHIVRGLLDWLDHGLVEPDAVREATAQYREDSDPLARFLKLCTEVEPQGRIQSSRLYEVFVAWCKAAGEREWSQKGFSKAMLDKGFTKKASDGMQWLGMRLVREAADFVDEHGKVRQDVPMLPDGAAAPPDGDAAAVPPPDIDEDYVPDF